METLQNPTCLAFDNQDRLFVFDRSSCTLFVFREDAYWAPVYAIMTWKAARDTPRPHRAPTLDEVRSLLPAPQGGLYVAETFGYRIWHLTEDGQFVRIIGNGEEGFTEDDEDARTGSIGPVFSMITDAQGRLIFFDRSRHLMRRLETDGTGTTLGGNYRLEYTPDGKSFRETALAEVSGLAFDLQQRLLFCDRAFNIVRRVDEQNTVKTICGVAEEKGFNGDSEVADRLLLNKPTKILVDTNNRLFVVDRGNQRIRLIHLDSEPLMAQTFSGTETPENSVFLDPYDIALDKQGWLYCSDTAQGHVFRLDDSGQWHALPNVVKFS